MDKALNTWYRNDIMSSIESEDIVEPVTSNTETIQEVNEDTADTIDQEETLELE